MTEPASEDSAGLTLEAAAAPEPTFGYRRLTRPKRRFSVVTAPTYSLWDGGDHLLQLHNEGYRESCRRLYYRDIQAITCKPTNLRRNLNLIFSAVFITPMLLIVWGAALSEAEDILSVLLFFGVPWAVLVLCNTLLGPSCVCHVHTAVQSEELRGITRLRVARRVLRAVRAAAENVQGPLAPEDAAARMAEWAGPDRGAAAAETEPVRFSMGPFHEAAFWALIVFGGVHAFAARYPEIIRHSILIYIPFLAVACLFVAALIHQRRTTIPRSLQRFTWVAFIFICVVSFVFKGYLLFPFWSFLNPEAEPLDALRGSLPASADRIVLNSISAICAIPLGVWGLFSVYTYRRSASARAGSGPEPARGE